ncbi:MAG: LON peptidase substrate-binding domain-containing protein, partial [Fimbriimonas ginsengisoli]|nr:LON peptidase substrate-binding domain-containing protein [Fimbriimonas ginsengisoli]
MKALQEARRHGRVIFLTAQREMSVDDPQEADLYPVGVVAHLLQLLQLPDGTVRVMVQGLNRARVAEWVQMAPHILVRAELIEEERTEGPEAEALVQAAMQELRALEQQKGIPAA